MDKKIKLAIIGLVGLLLASLIMTLQINTSKQTLEKQIEKLSAVNEDLHKQLENASAEKRRVEERIDVINRDLAGISEEKEALQRKYELVEKARESLADEIKTLKSAAPAMQRKEEPASFAASTTSAQDDAYWGGILRQKTDLEMQLAKVRAELKELQLNNEQLQREKSVMEMDVTGLNRDKQELNERLGYNQRIMESISADLAREKNDKLQLQDKLTSLKNENALLARQLKSLHTRKINLEEKISKLKQENEEYEVRLKEMDLTLQDKMSIVENIKRQLVSSQQKLLGTDRQSLELPAIIVRPGADKIDTGRIADISQSDFLGKIASINRDNNFVIVDFGENSGIKIGDGFRVYNNDELVGTIEAIQLRDTIVACDIKKEFKAIQAGDTVK